VGKVDAREPEFFEAPLAGGLKPGGDELDAGVAEAVPAQVQFFEEGPGWFVCVCVFLFFLGGGRGGGVRRGRAGRPER
jgi:hypothetical protein